MHIHVSHLRADFFTKTMSTGKRKNPHFFSKTTAQILCPIERRHDARIKHLIPPPNDRAQNSRHPVLNGYESLKTTPTPKSLQAGLAAWR